MAHYCPRKPQHPEGPAVKGRASLGGRQPRWPSHGVPSVPSESPPSLPVAPSVQRPVSPGTHIARATLWSQAAAGCGGPAGLLIVLKSSELFQGKLQSISGEWNLKGPNPFLPQTSNLVFVNGFENKYQKNPFLKKKKNYFFLLLFSHPSLAFSCFLGFYLFEEAALVAWPGSAMMAEQVAMRPAQTPPFQRMPEPCLLLCWLAGGEPVWTLPTHWLPLLAFSVLGRQPCMGVKAGGPQWVGEGSWIGKGPSCGQTQSLAFREVPVTHACVLHC